MIAFFASAPLDLSGTGSELVSGIILAAQAGLMILVAHYGLRLMVRAFKEVGTEHIEPENDHDFTAEEAEEMMWENGEYGPFGPDPRDADDERNYPVDVHADPEDIDEEGIEDDDQIPDGEYPEDHEERETRDNEPCDECGSYNTAESPEGDLLCNECGHWS